MKIFLSILIFLNISSGLFGQIINYRKKYNEKTKLIEENDDTSRVFDKINCFIHVDYRIYYDPKLIHCYMHEEGLNCPDLRTSGSYINRNTIDSLKELDSSKIDPYFFKRFYINESRLKDFCATMLQKKVENYSGMTLNFTHPDRTDSTVIIRQFNKLSDQLKNNETKSLVIPDSLKTLLRRYTENPIIYMDVLFFTDNRIRHYMTMNAIGVYRMYIVDLRNKTVDFYSYEISFSQNDTGLFLITRFDDVFKRYKGLIKRSKHYIKANRKLRKSNKKYE